MIVWSGFAGKPTTPIQQTQNTTHTTAAET